MVPPLYVIVGKQRDGKEVDLLKSSSPVVWEKPERVAAAYPTDRWRKLMMNLYLKSYSRYRGPYLRYLRRDWNTRHPPSHALLRIDMYFMRERTLPDYQKPTVEKILVATMQWSDAQRPAPKRPSFQAP